MQIEAPECDRNEPFVALQTDVWEVSSGVWKKKGFSSGGS